MIDINLEECATTVDKIVVNNKLFNHPNKIRFIPDFIINYSTIKCYKSLPSITTLEIKGRSVIKIHKTIFLNLINLINIDLSDNKLLKISKNFRLFTNLKSLKLNNNQIYFIPTFIGELKQLELLSLSRNLISAIPSSIQDLSKLNYLDISFNKIENIPIEFGLLNSLNVLHIDCNYFTKIPTTFCYLKKLNDLSFDWLEFINPPYYKNIKDSIGKIIISFILKTLQNMLQKGILFCDFQNFVDEMSIRRANNESNNKINIEPYDSLLDRSGINNELKNSQFCGSTVTIKSNNNLIISNKLLKIFSAIEGGYYGVIKSMLEGENAYEYLTIKNIENRTPLSLCFSKSNDLINLFLSKIKEQKIELNYNYLFKAIKLRNPELVKKLIYLGIKVDSLDDQGRGVLHILLSIFNKNISKCILMGNFLLSFNLNLNQLDNEGWGPIHLAAKRGSKECLLWIIEKNKKLRKEGKGGFDLNLKGKNDWTPLHLTVNGLRIEETMILLENGCDVFARNIDRKTPKQIGIANYVFSKLLSYYERIAMNNKYILNLKNNAFISNNSNNSKCIIKEKIIQKEEDVSISFFGENVIINNRDTINSNLFKNINIFKKDFEKSGNKSDNCIQKRSKLNTKKEDKIKNQNKNVLFSLKNNSSKKNMLNDSDNKNKTLNKTPNSNKKIDSQEKKTEYNDKYKKTYSFNNIKDTSVDKENNRIKNSFYEIREKLLYIGNSYIERLKNLTEIKINDKFNNIDLIKNIFENISYESQINIILLSDICNYVIQNCIYDLIPTFKELLTNRIIMNKYCIKKDLEKTIQVLELLEKGQKRYKKNKGNKIVSKNKNNYLNKNLNQEMFKHEKENMNNSFFKNSEINEFKDIEKNNNNYDRIFLKTEVNRIIFGDKIGKIKQAKDIKLSKGNILNIDIKKLEYNQKIKRQYNKLGNLNYNQIKKIKDTKYKNK